jgi:hypothetical protein
MLYTFGRFSRSISASIAARYAGMSGSCFGSFAM